jgi:hypothetical protein
VCLKTEDQWPVLSLTYITETLRMGTVSLSVPEPIHQTERRQSTALSIGHTEDSGSMRPNRDTGFTAASSLGIPGNIEDLLRTSFGTSLSVPERESQTEDLQSTQLSIDNVDGGSRQLYRDTIVTSTSSQGVSGSFDGILRTSLITTASSASHMSNIIGDFPAPPAADEVTASPTDALQPPSPTLAKTSDPRLRQSSVGSTSRNDY